MINDVRKAVLSIINKDNNGYLTPEEFNVYAKQAQLEIYEQYFHDYSLAVNKRNQHMHTSGLGDVTRRIAEIIERFTTEGILTWNGITLRYDIPSDAYKMESTYMAATNIDIEYAAQSEIRRLLNSMDSAPSESYPVYSILGDALQVYPSTITGTGTVIMNYIRYPKDPKWTYNSFADGEPLFNISAADYQDFEIELDDFYNLVAKICQYAGVQIREEQVVRYMKTEELQEKQEQK